jgi:hypothetical protein
MIQNLFVSTELGELIYARNLAGKKMDVDENILIGFLTAIGNFSKEAFKNFINLLDIDTERKMVIHYQPKERLITAAIVDSRDDTGLVQVILKNFASGLIAEHGSNLDPATINKPVLDKELDGILKGKTAPRNPKISLLALLLSLGFGYPLVWAGIFISFLIANNIVMRVSSSSVDSMFVVFLPGMLLVILAYTSIIFIFPMLLAGFVAGQYKHVIIIDFIHWGFVLVVGFLISNLVIGNNYLFFIFITYTPVVFIFMFFFSYLGVLISAKKKLYT